MWMSDKPMIQEELAESMASMIHVGKGADGVCFIEAFFATVTREWLGLDRLRLDKFYNLIRCVMVDSMRLLANHAWNEELVDSFCASMQQEVFDMGSNKARGVALNVIDYWLTDLVAAKCPIGNRMLEPILQMIAANPESVFRTRIREKIIQPLCEGSVELELDHERLGTRSFKLGASQKTSGKARKLLYHLSHELKGQDEPAKVSLRSNDALPVSKPEVREKLQKRKSQKTAMASGGIETVIAHTPSREALAATAAAAAEELEENTASMLTAVVSKKSKKKSKQKSSNAPNDAPANVGVASPNRIRFSKELERPASPPSNVNASKSAAPANSSFENSLKHLKRRKMIPSLSEESLVVRTPKNKPGVEADPVTPPAFLKPIKSHSEQKKSVKFNLQKNETLRFKKGSVVGQNPKRRHSTGDVKKK